ATGELAIIVTPPARIWLDGKPLGQTPLRTIVAAGRHSVQIASDATGRGETAIITIAPDQIATLERHW
ncbi:MAG: PEGA domain-containing protein, partial [Kofleriaceae bacterium]